MKHLLFVLAVLIACSLGQGSELVPTGLTIVVCDSSNKVLDTVAVPDNKKSCSVKFSLPDSAAEIRVFALGKRQHKDLPSGYYITGLPDDKKSMGLGYVEVHVEKGLLIGIDGNGFGPLEIDEELEKQVLADLKDGKPAEITALKVDGEE